MTAPRMPRAPRGVGAERRTRQKAAVQGALEAARAFASPADLHRMIEASGSRIGLSTVYRRLNALAASGEAETLVVDGERLYRACELGGEHHHHLVCESCGAARPVRVPDDEWIRSVADAHGFRVFRHELEIYGRCADCAESVG